MKGLRYVLARRAVTGPSRLINRWDLGESYVELPIKYIETLSCGCRREVTLRSASGAGSQSVQVAWFVRFDESNFDPMKHLYPQRRRCCEDGKTKPSPERTAYMKRMRAFNRHLNAVAEARGLTM